MRGGWESEAVPDEPAVRPYGIEAVLRDDSGNWYSFTQRKA
jgi:hypothetical protein